jgi:RNA polymerase sigma factor (sigma-70 family)
VRLPRVADDGSIDISSVNEMKSEDISEWLRTRLQGRDLGFSGGNKGDDSPHYLVAVLYPRLERATRFDIEAAVVSFLRDLATNQNSEWLGKPGTELFMLSDPVLVNSTQREIVIDTLLGLANRMSPRTEPNLHLKSLQALVAMRHRASRQFWQEQFKLGGEAYTPTILGGLRLVDLSTVIDWMGETAWSEGVEAAIVGILPILLEEYGTAKVTGKFEELTSIDPRTAKAILNFLSEEGVEVRLQGSEEAQAASTSRIARKGEGRGGRYSLLATAELLRACAGSKDEGAWSEFIRRFQVVIAAAVLSAARHWDEPTRPQLDDLTQETYLKLCENDSRLLRSFQPRHEDSIYGFLKVVAANVVHDHFKSALAAKRGAGEIEAIIEPAQMEYLKTVPTGTHDAMNQRLELEQIDKILREVTAGRDQERKRTIFWLRHRQGLTTSEIAAMPSIGLNQEDVESILRRLAVTIRSRIRGHQIEKVDLAERHRLVLTYISSPEGRLKVSSQKPAPQDVNLFQRLLSSHHGTGQLDGSFGELGGDS